MVRIATHLTYANGLRVLLVCLVAVAVATVNAASASAALGVCIKNSDGTMREAKPCKASEHSAQLVTAAELAAQQTQSSPSQRAWMRSSRCSPGSAEATTRCV
jgi:hypothetical protein